MNAELTIDVYITRALSVRSLCYIQLLRTEFCITIKYSLSAHLRDPGVSQA